MDDTKSRPRPRKTAAKAATQTKTPKKVATAKRSSKAAGSVAVDRESMVRLAAYFRAERRGFAPGYEIEDWLAAEAEVSARQPARPTAQPRKTAVRKPRAGGGGAG